MLMTLQSHVIRPGWSAQMHERGALSLERRAVSAREGQSG
jgi:hypothetical protein